MQNIKKTGLTGLAFLTLAGTMLPALAAPQSAPASKTDTTLARVMASRGMGFAHVIVRTAGPLTATQQAQLAALGAGTYRHLPIIHSIAVTVPTRNLAKLDALPFVTHLSYDGIVKKCDQFTVASSGAGTAYQQYGLDGTGVTVAVIDSGVNNVQDFSGKPSLLNSILGLLSLQSTRLMASVSFVPNDSSTNDACGHGTHVAGIIGGNGSSSTGLDYYRTFYGIARKANLVNVRVLDGNGQGNVSDVVSGIQWVVTNKTKYGIRVINMSMGHPVGESYTTDPLCQAVESAWKAGIVVVCAAGNEGRLDSVQDQPDNEGWGTNYGSIDSPGNDPYVITVGATKSMDGNRVDDKIATYSSRGPSRLDLILKPDVVAPGNLVISTQAQGSTLAKEYNGTNLIPSAYYTSLTLGGNSPTYFRLSGTSMATPVVAGAAAMLLQKYPTLTPDTVKLRLMLSAGKLAAWNDANGNYDALTYGAGYLDIPAALTSTAVAGQYAMSPDLSEDASGNVTINMDHAIWGTSLWGSGLTDLHAIWGKDALWGSNTLASSHAIWGKSVWSDHAIWGKTTDAVDLSSVVINGE